MVSKAAIQGHPDAQYSLGLMYRSGEGTNKVMLDQNGSKQLQNKVMVMLKK